MDIYYLDNFSNLSAIISVVLFLGLYQLGKILDNKFKIDNFIKSKNIWAHYPLISIIFILSFLSPLIYLKILDTIIIKLVAYSLFILGCYLIYNLIQSFFLKKKKIKNIHNIYYYIFLIFILNFFLISLSPTTHADALDYHASGAQYIINNGMLPTNPLWFHGKLIGLGELIIAIGFIIGGEQFGSLVQFSGIISAVQVFLDIRKKNNNDNNFYLIILIILSSPVMIYFLGSSKPHLLQSSFFLLLLKIIVFDIKKISKKNIEWLFLFFLVGSIIFMNIKFSSILSSFILGIYFLYIIFQRKMMSVNIMTYTLIIFIILMSPKLYFNYIEYGTNIITSLLFSLPVNIDEFKIFYLDLKQIHDSPNLFNSIFFPKNMGNFSTVLGVGPILIFALTKIDTQKKLIISLTLSYLLIAYLYGPRQSRFYFDPYLWVLLCIVNINFTKNYLTKLFILFGKIQILIFLCILSYGSFILFYGSLNSHFKDKVLKNNANGYELFKWVNHKLPEKSTLLSSHRSIGFSQKRVISTDYRRYLKDNKKISQYLINSKPSHILFYGQDENSIYYKKCLGKKIAHKKNAGIHAVRNIFHKKKLKRYNAWIYEFDLKKLPSCLN